MCGTVCLYNSKVAGYKADVGAKVYREYSKFWHLHPFLKKLIRTTTEVMVCADPRRGNYWLHP